VSSLHEQIELEGLPPERAEASIGERVRAFYELGKPNLSGLVVVTGVTGFYVGSTTIDWIAFLHLISGLFLTAVGACALNMVLEYDVDARMRRTQSRPIPSGRVTRTEALVFSLVTFAVGFAQLSAFINLLTAMLSLVTLLIYAFVYTPMKVRGPVATWIGAIPGAIPPVMGWTAATGSLDAPALVLFGILFFWQLPHFLALAWIYREDYARAGYRLLPGKSGSNHLAGVQMMLCCIALLKVSLILAAVGAAGVVYVAGALISGIVFAIYASRVARSATHRDARALFFASIVYLPVLLGFIVLDRALLG